MTRSQAYSESHVDVWSIYLVAKPEGVEKLRTTLSHEEDAHGARFRKREDRVRYIIAHGALRQVLESYTGISAAELRFERGIGGKPFLAVPDDAPLNFNLSHSGDRALIAVAKGRPVGVDIERIDPDVDAVGIAARFFSRAEHAALLAADEAVRLQKFFRLWVCKEAYIKARGESISGRLATFSIDVSDETDVRLSEDALAPHAPQRWHIRLLKIDPSGYAAAVAVEGAVGGVHLIHWNGRDEDSHPAPSPEHPAA